MATFTERFKMLYDEKKSEAKKNNQNYSFNHLGDYFGIDSKLKSTTLHGYYDGSSKNPTLENLKELANYFGVSVSYLIGESDIRSLDYQSDYEVFEKYGFSADTMRSLISISQKEKNVSLRYKKALEYLLTDFWGNDSYPILLYVGEYLLRIRGTGQNIVNSTDLDILKDRLNCDKPNYKEVMSTLNSIIENSEPYSTDELDMYLLTQITSYLRELRKFFDEEQSKKFEELKQKSPVYVEKIFDTYLKNKNNSKWISFSYNIPDSFYKNKVLFYKTQGQWAKTQGQNL